MPKSPQYTINTISSWTHARHITRRGKEETERQSHNEEAVCGSHSTARPYQDRKQRVQHVPKNHNGKPAFTSPADDTSCSYI